MPSIEQLAAHAVHERLGEVGALRIHRRVKAVEVGDPIVARDPGALAFNRFQFSALACPRLR